jgi:hypothetical protein
MKVAAMVAVAAMIGTGCASVAVTQSHNRAVERRALQIQPTNDGRGLMAAVDLLSLDTGYLAAWRDRPLAMTGATLVDGAAAGLVYYLATQDDGGGEDKPEKANIENNGGTVIINSGDGDVNYSTKQGGGEE